ncbi:MAG: gamma-glutamylcyclotransferase [Magnetococcales bacterium]|nr:gamma-glutamylcyclotransferase [Magnetococcales bacterium]
MTNHQKIPVFVYGTLKRGCSNHYLMGKTADPIMTSATGLLMYQLPGYPMAMPGNGVIHGELYWVDQESVRRLDRLEGHPKFFCRELWKLDHPDISAWIYLCPDGTGYPIIESGNWVESRTRYNEIIARQVISGDPQNGTV